MKKLKVITILLSTLFFAQRGTAEVKSSLRLVNESFISPLYEATPDTSYRMLSAKFKTAPFSRQTESGAYFDIEGAYAMGAPLMSYLNIRELNYVSVLAPNQRITLGRSVRKWSDLDSRWNLGVWQPLFKWNPLNPSNQGLSGLFWDYENEKLRLTLFSSFFYLPSQGPGFELNQNGEFEKGNPWFNQPPQAIRVMQEVSKIEYHFHKPSEMDIVSQTSIAANAVYEGIHWIGRISAGFKPHNTLAFEYDGLLNISKDKGVLEVYPEVYTHSVFGGDLIYRTSEFRIGMSALVDKPIPQSNSDLELTKPVFQEAVLYSPFIEVKMGSFKMTYDYLKILGGEVSEIGEWARPNGEAISSRYPLYEAHRLGLNFLHPEYSIGGNFITSPLHAMDIIQFESKIQLQKYVVLEMGAQLMKSNDTSSEVSEISHFANNDRVSLGVAYVF